MTELAKEAGSALAAFFQRHAAAVVSVVFALGFAWAQFAVLDQSLDDTRAELRRLRDDFLAFRLGDDAARRAEIGEIVAAQREIDRRQDADLQLLRALLLRSEARLGRDVRQ